MKFSCSDSHLVDSGIGIPRDYDLVVNEGRQRRIFGFLLEPIDKTWLL